MKYDAAMSRRVLQVIFVIIAAFMAVRLGYFVFGFGTEATVLDSQSVMNAVTPMIAAVLPVVGTTAFLLMCSERLRRQWEHAASTDHLTGLANRRTLTEAGAKRLFEARAKKEPFAVAVIDVDHFKQVNDRHGHDVGDLALKHVANKLAGACRSADLAARQGGEEFVVVFGDVDPMGAKTAAERLREAVEGEVFMARQTELRVTVSVGVAVLLESDETLDDVLRRADEALYRAKSNGRNRVELA